jgi:hypothetical protein
MTKLTVAFSNFANAPKKKDKVVPVQPVKTHGGRGWRYGCAHSLNQHQMEMRGQFHASATSPPCKQPPVRPEWEVGWPL